MWLDLVVKLGEQSSRYLDSSDEDDVLGISSDSDYIGSSDEGIPYNFFFFIQILLSAYETELRCPQFSLF